MNAEAFVLGQKVVCDCVNRHESIPEAIATFDQNADFGHSAYFGAIHSCVHLVGFYMESGERQARIIGKPLNQFPSRNLLTIAHSTRIRRNNADELKAWTESIVLAANAIRTQCPSIEMSLPDPMRKEIDAMPVSVVSLPDRETHTTIERDQQGNIISSTQRETDTVPEPDDDKP